MELLDVFDELYNPLESRTATIDEVHTKGLWHQTFACWLVNKQRKTVLLQLRGPRNKIDPGSFDASAGGHLVSGEVPSDGFREVSEELGISIDDRDKYYAGVFRNIAIRGSYINHEFCHVYLAISNHALHDFSPEEGEVNDLFEVEVQAAIDLFSNKRQSITGQSAQGTIDITIEKMCNYKERTQVSKYYLSVMTCAQKILNGEQDIFI